MRVENPLLSDTIRGLTGVQFFNILLPNLITLFFITATIVALFYLIFGGIKWVTSGGDREAAAKARNTITSALIGLVLTLAAYTALNLIGYFFNINLTSFDISALVIGPPQI